MIDLIVTLTMIYEKLSTSNKVFLLKRLFNMKMVDGSLVAEHLNNFNIVMNHLCLVGIKLGKGTITSIFFVRQLRLNGWKESGKTSNIILNVQGRRRSSEMNSSRSQFK